MSNEHTLTHISVTRFGSDGFSLALFRGARFGDAVGRVCVIGADFETIRPSSPASGMNFWLGNRKCRAATNRGNIKFVIGRGSRHKRERERSNATKMHKTQCSRRTRFN